MHVQVCFNGLMLISICLHLVLTTRAHIAQPTRFYWMIVRCPTFFFFHKQFHTVHQAKNAKMTLMAKWLMILVPFIDSKLCNAFINF